MVTIAVKDRKSDSFLKLEPFVPTGSTNDFLLFDPFIVSVFVQHVRTKAVTSHLLTPLFTFIHLPLCSSTSAPPPRLLIDFKNSKITYMQKHIIMHLLLFLSPDWLIFCHITIMSHYCTCAQ